MDRPIKKTNRAWKKPVVVAFVAITLLLAVFLQGSLQEAFSTVSVPKSQTTISRVQNGQLDDVISIRGNVQPLNSVFLDAISGGVVEQIHVEEGAFVEKGQLLLQLSNTSLRLSASSNDTAITEQLNNLTNIINSLETTKLSTEREIINLEYRIKSLERSLERSQTLLGNKMISQAHFDDVSDELIYQKLLLDNTMARQTLETTIRENRRTQINSQILKLEENLALSQSSFESLQVRAPISGQLTSLPVQLGESMNSGQRLGQIDIANEYGIVAKVDEFYVSRIALGQTGSFFSAGRPHSVSVGKIYPEIENGQFEIDLIFDGELPSTLTRGQSMNIELMIGSSKQALVVNAGSFLQETGGNWAFVLDNSGDYAQRRAIQTGRRNNTFIEVISGLSEGEQVITSNYTSMADADRVKLSN